MQILNGMEITNMNIKQIYFKTMIFIWAKLGLNILAVTLSGLWLVLCISIGSALNSFPAFFICLGISVGGIKFIYHLIYTYIGYLVKVAHIAVIVQAVKTGQLPDNMLEYGIKQVKTRFISSNAYFIVDRLVNGSVRQLQGTLNKADGFLANIPGLSVVFTFLKFFINIALGYVDECCLAYTFLNEGQSAFRSACDGVILYFQNWKKQWKNLIITTIIAMGSYAVLSSLTYSFLGGVLKFTNISTIVVLFLAILITIAIKTAFIDSLILVRMITTYLKAIDNTVISVDIYTKFNQISSKLRELFERGEKADIVSYK